MYLVLPAFTYSPISLVTTAIRRHYPRNIDPKKSHCRSQNGNWNGVLRCIIKNL